MAQYSTEQLVIGTLIHNPKLLLQKDKYQITQNDFENIFYKGVFWAIENLAPGAQKDLEPYEIEKWISDSPRFKELFDRKNGRQVLADCCGVPVSSFDALYSTFQKENLIKDLKGVGFDTSKIYVENPLSDKERRIDELYSQSSVQDLISSVDADFMAIKSKYTLNDTSEVRNASDDLRELFESFAESPELGLPLAGKYFNHIVGGAMPGQFYLRSGSSGLGKTRNAIIDACELAYPIKYNWASRKWEIKGFNENVMVIITEQTFEEVQKMILACISGVNETAIKRNLLSEEQRKIVLGAIDVIEHFQDNLKLVRVPSPSITLIKQLIREQVSLYNIKYVFYDYIFVSQSLLAEFKGNALRNDEILLIFSDTLKQLAVELGVFMMSSTQVNSKADDSNDIRNEASIAGSRAVINKADVGCIMARPTQEELKTLEPIIEQVGLVPNVVTDIYKLRGGENTQTRIWSVMDLGTLKRTDLFVTDARLDVIHLDYEKIEYAQEDEIRKANLQNINLLNSQGRLK